MTIRMGGGQTYLLGRAGVNRGGENPLVFNVFYVSFFLSLAEY